MADSIANTVTPQQLRQKHGGKIVGKVFQCYSDRKYYVFVSTAAYLIFAVSLDKDEPVWEWVLQDIGWERDPKEISSQFKERWDLIAKLYPEINN